VNAMETTVPEAPDLTKADATAAAGTGARARLRTRGPRPQLDQFALLPVLAIAMIAGALLQPAFLTQSNLLNVLRQSSELSLLVMAESVILIANKFDLSLESIVGLAPMLAAWLVSPKIINGSGLELNSWLALLILLGTGAAVGAINAFFVVKLRINAFMTTLAMLILLRGITTGVTDGKTLYNLPANFLYIGTNSWLGVPVSVWCAGLLYIVGGLFLRYHRIGRALYAVGGNAEAARSAGIRVNRLLVAVYVFGGALAAFAGLMLTGRLASVTSTQGQNMIFTVFAAAVIGRISLNGGRGTLFGALTGVLLLGVISNILTLSNIQPFWINAAFGAIILVALVIARFTSGEMDAT
jgi:simple sugar transport system permease protein